MAVEPAAPAAAGGISPAGLKLLALADRFISGPQAAEGLGPFRFTIRGLLPMVRTRLAKAKPEELRGLCLFLTACAERIADDDMTPEEFGAWVTALSPETAGS